MQRTAGLDVRWVDAAEACRLNPTLAAEGHRGGSYRATDGAIDPPRNVRAYSLAMQRPASSSASGRRSSGCGQPRRAGAAARHRRGHAGRRHRHGTGDPDGRTRACGRSAARRGTDLRRRSTAPGRRHRTASRLRHRAPADGLRRRGGHLLAARRRRVALGHVEPEGEAGAGARDRLAVPSSDAAPARRAGARDARGWASARRGAGRSTTRRTTCRSSVRSSPPMAR